MEVRRSFFLASFALASTFIPSASAAGLSIAGSSTVYPITSLAIKKFNETGQGKNVSISLRSTGSSAGFRDFCNNKIPLTNASRPISATEIIACQEKGVNFIELPIAFDAITVVANQSNRWLNSLTPSELSRLWSKASQGKVKNWNQVNLDFPDKQIKLCGPGKDSGTFDIFNKAINKSKTNSRTDYKSSEDDNVIVNCVANNSNALGYFGFSYFLNNRSKLKAIRIVNSKGNAILPSVAAVQKEIYQPLSRPLFLYVNDRSLRNNTSLRNFITYYLRNVEQLVTQANYIPLQNATYRLVDSKLYRHILGTSFGGKIPVGLTIGQILQTSFDVHKKPQFR